MYMYKQNSNKNFCRHLVENIGRVHFPGASGDVHFEGSDRFSSIDVMQFFHNGTCVIGSYNPITKGNQGQLILDRSKIKWLTPGGKAPNDGQKGGKVQSLLPYSLFIKPLIFFFLTNYIKK